MKMPFVVTMSVAAGACGGTVTDASHRGQVVNGETGGSGATPSGTGGGNPIGGSGGWSTGGAPATGGWVPEFNTGGSIGGDFSMGGTVNPPYPGGNGGVLIGVCPTDPPVAGTYCNGFPPDCSYPGNQPCQSMRTFACLNGSWSESDTYAPTCNPPMPVCPPIEPTTGESCMQSTGYYYSGPDCEYGNCYGNPTSFWNCRPVLSGSAVVGQAWNLVATSTCNPPPPGDFTDGGAGGAAPADAGAAIPPG